MNSSNSSNTVLQFPVSSEQNISKNTEHINKKPELNSVAYFHNQWLKLFNGDEKLADTKILTDRPNEILRVNTDVYALNWLNQIWETIKRPTNNAQLIQARKDIINTVNWLSDKFHKSLYDYRNLIIKLNLFKDTFDNLDDLWMAIEILEKLEKIENLNDIKAHELIDASLFIMWIFWNWNIDDFQEIKKSIPWYIQLIRNIEWDFFTKVADELLKSYEKAKNFSIDDLKKIHKEKDYEALDELTQNIKNFCEIFNIWDSILIISEWVKDWKLDNIKEIDLNQEEKAYKINDPRHLLTYDLDQFFEHIKNDLPTQDNLEVYAWWNWSWKSTWLKSRLLLQLFFQTYWFWAAKNWELPIRDQIVYINRWGSGYWEDLSAFWNDIQNKLLPFLTSLKKWSLIFLDEFGSTVPENEAYYLIRALMEHLIKNDSKVLSATHNEKYINWILKNKPELIDLFNFKCKVKKNWTMDFSYKLQKWKDTAHTINVFKTAWMPIDVLRTANNAMLWQTKRKNINRLHQDKIEKYTQEEREILKWKNKWFEWLSRYNEMVKFEKWKWHISIWRKYIPLEYWNRPNNWYSDEDLFFTEYYPNSLGEKWPEPSFDFQTFSEDRAIQCPEHLHSKWFRRKNIYDSTLEWLTTWWLTSDIKELHERQELFEQLWEIPFNEIDQYYKNINHFTWIINNFWSGLGIMWKNLDFDYSELKKFNKTYWDYFLKNIEKYSTYHWTKNVLERFNTLIKMEDILWNISNNFYKKHKKLLEKINKTIKLLKKYNIADSRRLSKWDDKFKNVNELINSVKEKINTQLGSLWWENSNLIKEIRSVYEEISISSSKINILDLEEEKRSLVISNFQKGNIFARDDDGLGWLENWFIWMHQVLCALKWKGNLITPILEKLRSINSVHTNQIANYLEDFIDIPNVEDFIEAVKLKILLDENIALINSQIEKFQSNKETKNKILKLIQKWKNKSSYDEEKKDLELLEKRFFSENGIFSLLRYNWNFFKWLLNMFESFNIPGLRNFVELLDQNIILHEKYSKKRKLLNIDREHSWSAIYELLWIVDVANQIKELWWAKVDFNNTWKIDIKGLHNPWLELSKAKQIKNDFHMSPTQSFWILEWATMWWKTNNIKSMHWIIRLAHSIWFVPAESASLPKFDGLIYIDRILEDEKNQLSAWQNDAKIWSEIILKIRKTIQENSEKWKYWFAIDEMISSVPSIYQKWLVIAILEELKSLWQRWQISLHNPWLVTQLLEIDPESYTIHHPWVEFNEDWELDYTYQIRQWRSVNKSWIFSAYSLETAEKMGLPIEIINRAKEIRDEENKV